MRESTQQSNVYKFLNQIGRGSYASVYRAINRQTGKICAIKKISSDTSDLNRLIEEIKIMSNCKCENIVHFLASEYLNNEVLIFMEYCCGGSVKDVMRQLGRTITEEQILVILKDVLNGLSYLHSTKKVHRDVKAANILLNEQGIAKLGDFGVSETLEKPDSRKCSIIGTLLWLPPEVLNQTSSLEYRTAIDIWSLGITIIEMGDGQPPYSDLEQNAALEEIRNLEKQPPKFRHAPNWSSSLNEFLSLCLDKDATKRKSAKELLHCQIIRCAKSNNIIKSLVEEVCSNHSCTTAELETNLYKKSKYLLEENSILLRIHEDLRMKVVRVDQMTNTLASIKRDFRELQDMMLSRDDEIAKIKAESNLLTEAMQKLERERNEWKATLARHKDRKMNIIDQLEKIQDQLTRFDSEESQRRTKLRSLEGKSG